MATRDTGCYRKKCVWSPPINAIKGFRQTTKLNKHNGGKKAKIWHFNAIYKTARILFQEHYYRANKYSCYFVRLCSFFFKKTPLIATLFLDDWHRLAIFWSMTAKQNTENVHVKKNIFLICIMSSSFATVAFSTVKK